MKEIAELMTALMLYCGHGTSNAGDCKKFMTECARFEADRWQPNEAKIFFECTNRWENGLPVDGKKKREVIR